VYLSVTCAVIGLIETWRKQEGRNDTQVVVIAHPRRTNVLNANVGECAARNGSEVPCQGPELLLIVLVGGVVVCAEAVESHGIALRRLMLG